MLLDGQLSRKGNIVPTKLGYWAKQYGLSVHTYTVRKDKLPEYANSMEELLEALIKAGANGIFTDFPDLAVQYFST